MRHPTLTNRRDASTITDNEQILGVTITEDGTRENITVGMYVQIECGFVRAVLFVGMKNDSVSNDR